MKRKIICLIGSTKYFHAFTKVNEYETLQGNIVLSCGVFKTKLSGALLQNHDKEALDGLHKDKIRMSDDVIVINAENYIGDSTQSEIDYAKALGKVIRYTYKRPIKKGKN